MWIRVNIGSGDGLLPDGTKPLPEPMLTYYQWVMCYSHERFHSKHIDDDHTSTNALLFRDFIHIVLGHGLESHPEWECPHEFPISRLIPYAALPPINNPWVSGLIRTQHHAINYPGMIELMSQWLSLKSESKCEQSMGLQAKKGLDSFTISLHSPNSRQFIMESHQVKTVY